MTDTREEQIARAMPAIENLKNYQQQLDADGCMVGVSRQALDETLAFVATILATEAAPSEPLDDKLVYIKPLRTLVRVQTMYADQVRDLCNAPAAPSEPVADDVCRLVIAARIVAFEDQSADALRELDKASEAFADRVKWNDEPPAQPDTTKSGGEG